MDDAGELNGRAEPVPDADAPSNRGETPSGGLSKRAARRRRRRRAAKGEAAAAEKPERDPAPPNGSRDGAAKGNGRKSERPADESRKAARRSKRSPKPSQPGQSDNLRGVRQTHHRPGGSRGDSNRRGDADPRGRDGARRHEQHRRPETGEPRTRPHHGPGTEPAAPHRGRGHRVSSGGPLYAALDLGTNNCRLLIAEPQERGFRVIDAFSRIVRLGEGIGRSGRLGEAAMDRAVEALAVCREKMLEHDVRRMRLVATEACRAAENGPVFLERVRAETGLRLEIVNRETEARLAVAGCATLVDPRAEGVLLFDIGGGSSELVWLDLRNRGEARGFALTRFIKAWTSLPVGVVTLSERHGGVHVTRDVFEAMVGEVAAMLDGFGSDEILPILERGGIHMLGTSGTVTTLAGIHLGLKRYDRRRVDGVWLDKDDVDRMVGELVDMTYEERVANACIGADRADLVLAGCAILEGIRRRWPCQRLRVADRGLREGILVELMARDGVWRRRPRPALAPNS